MHALELSKNKSLKLTNVLVKDIQNDDIRNLDKIVQLINEFIKSKGCLPIGPLIQYNSFCLSNNNEIDIITKYFKQSNNYINHIERPYDMVSVIRVPNCMYCRYIGPEENLRFAYDKIKLTAHEDNILLKGDSYTVLIGKNEEDDTIIADVFMERAD